MGAVAVAVGVAGTVYAYAGGWTLTTNRASLTATVAKMPRGVEPSVAKQDGQAVVSWSAQELVAGVRMDHYVVTAHSVSEPARPDVAHAVAASGAATESLVFPAGEVGGGKWRWSIVPKYREWTGEASKPSPKLAFPAVPVPQVAAAAVPPAAVTSPSPAPATPSATSPAADNGVDATEVRTTPPAVKVDPTTPAAVETESTPLPVPPVSEPVDPPTS